MHITMPDRKELSLSVEGSSIVVKTSRTVSWASDYKISIRFKLAKNDARILIEDLENILPNVVAKKAPRDQYPNDLELEYDPFYSNTISTRTYRRKPTKKGVLFTFHKHHLSLFVYWREQFLLDIVITEQLLAYLKTNLHLLKERPFTL